MPITSTNPYLSVVIPAYNEAANFQAGVLNPVVEYLKKQKYSWEIILVNDGSTDDTKELLQEFCRNTAGFELLNIEHGGKSAAVTAGVLTATGKIVLFTDFDQSTPISQTEKFIKRHEEGADVVIGHRARTKKDTWVRKIRSWAFVTWVQIVALPGIMDSQCGFKSFTREAAQKIFKRLKVSLPNRGIMGGYMGAFDVEVLFLARKFGFRIDQVEVEWIKFVSDRLNIWKEPLQMAIDTVRVRLYDILDRYHEN